ncbi:hypothetical protein [Peterkaempfera bronchialis]|uniref:Glycosyltransferase RgtA/B/C/D-like domain-containing protein n=1 Tax=Peterkaempfera bronchialis TaxID=2126346 RepID=A0A345SWL7_9ACTN|nr:hypothetical protein [Peterkaempfera bronchialis]AXI78122.1 hypothetical protein C7M71_012385 [Peterkaempfera bronchialis]
MGQMVQNSPAATSTAPTRVRALRLPLPYTVFAVLALLVILPLCIKLPWSGDQGLHAAVIERLRTDLSDPTNPLIAEETPSPYFSPWMLLLGALARATGWDTFTVLSLAAVAACVLLVTGVYRFVRTLTDHRWAPVLALPLLVLLWGWHLFAWSGWIPFTSLTLTISYPSTFALGLTLNLWAWLQQEARAGWRLLPCLALGLLTATVLLVHQFTGAIALLGALAVVAAAPAGRSLRALRNLAAGGLVLAVVLTLWPYYDFWELASAGGDLASVHQALYRDLLPRYGLALLALPALAVRARRTRGLDPLVLLFLACGAVFTAGGLLGHWSWGRVWPGVMLAAQLALAVELAALAPGRLRRAAGAVVAAALAVGVWTQVGVVTYALPRYKAVADRWGVQQIATFGDYSWITPFVRYGDVILTHNYYALRMAPAYGATTVAPAYPDFFLPDERQRWKDTATFFDRRTTAAQGRAILLRYHVAWLIKSAGERPVPRGSLFTPMATGPHGERLIRVDLAALSAQGR